MALLDFRADCQTSLRRGRAEIYSFPVVVLLLITTLTGTNNQAIEMPRQKYRKPHIKALKTRRLTVGSFLSRSLVVKYDCDDTEHHVWYPHRHHRRCDAFYGKGRRDRHEQDVSEGENETDAEVYAHAASDLA